ncbi:MAG TPA: SRPBCC domain-containing protein [Ktedonobacteraceae bacterium]|nr:SRPBCC domain-containing protein [Ktedonobacteraceae bacterium]
MDIEGTYTLQASQEDVWHCLMDAQALRQAIPGVERLEVLGEYKHGITLDIRQSPLMGAYCGQVTVTERHYPSDYSIVFEGEGRQSTISGQGVVQLHTLGENTIVSYKGTVNLGKLATLLSSPVVKGATKLLMQQFFLALADQLRVMHPASVLEAGSGQSNADGSRLLTLAPVEDDRSNGEGYRAEAEMLVAPPTIVHRIVQLLGIGEGDIEQELLWEQRVRRYGIIAGLLFLVWVGTRLPRHL